MSAQTATKKAKKQADEPDNTAKRMTARSLHVDQTTLPNEPHSAPISGCMVEVVDGPHKGRVGIFRKSLTAEPGETKPTTILVHTRDDDKIDIEVNYDDCVRAKPGRR